MRDTAPKRPRLALVALLAALLAVALGACGSDDEGGGSAGGGDKAKAAEKAFLTAMVPHHETAIEMAEIAEDNARTRFVARLAKQIESTQEREISEMKEIHQRRLGGELRPDESAHDGLGLSAEQAGMTHDADSNEALRNARPFDRAFVDEMTPHHEGAVRMATVVLKSTEDSQLRELAQSIVDTQRREIREMSTFRTRKYGAPVPKQGGHSGGGGAPVPGGAEEHHGAEHP